MLKLYRFTDSSKEYWETWETGPGEQMVHWGKLGTRGSTKTVKTTFLRKAEKTIQSEIDALIKQGYTSKPIEENAVLMIEFAVDGFGTPSDIEKRHRLQDRMNETLGWTGLGACDGGSIGSDTMEVCNFVVDYEVAKRVIELDLLETEFANFTRIYDEGVY